MVVYLLQGQPTNVEIGGNFIADGSSNDLDLRNAGTTGILLRGRGNQTSYIGNDSYAANLGIGTTNPNEKLTVVGAISASTKISSPIISATTLTVDGNIGVSGGEIAMGTNKITGLGDPTAAQDSATKNYVDIQYAYQYITFVGNTGALGDDNWKGPGTNGISNHTWGETWDGVDGLLTGDTVLSVGRTEQHAYIRVPAGAQLIGLEGVVRSSTDDRVLCRFIYIFTRL